MADTILTDTPGWAALNVPTPGDPVKAALPDGAVRSGFQKLGNRTTAIIEGLHSPVRAYLLQNFPLLYNLTILPLGWVGLIDSGGRWRLVYHNVTSVYDVTTSGALAADTRYYIYAYESGGSLAFERSTTAPDDKLQYKTGDKTRVYISTFITSDSSVPMGYTQSGRVYTYSNFVQSTFEAGTPPGAHGNLVLNDASITAFDTSLTFGIAAPDYARQVNIRVSTVGTATQSRVQIANNFGSTSDAGRLLNYMGEDSFGIQAVVDQPANRGLPATLVYRWASTTPTMKLNLWVIGFVE